MVPLIFREKLFKHTEPLLSTRPGLAALELCGKQVRQLEQNVVAIHDQRTDFAVGELFL